MKKTSDFNIYVTQEEIAAFCLMGKDLNPQHRPDADRIVVPGILVLTKSLGETDTLYWTVWLVEENLRFKKPIYLDEEITVTHTLQKEKQTKNGVLQVIEIDVKVKNDIRYTGWMKILKVPNK